MVPFVVYPDREADAAGRAAYTISPLSAGGLDLQEESGGDIGDRGGDGVGVHLPMERSISI